jgi:hypothetical protein
MACLLKSTETAVARPLLNNRHVMAETDGHKIVVTVGSVVSFAVRAEAIRRGPVAITSQSRACRQAVVRSGKLVVRTGTLQNPLKTAGQEREDRNRTLVCVWYWFVKCSHELF